MMGWAMWGRLDEHSLQQGNWVNSRPKTRKAADETAPPTGN